ncbi:EamA family transporter [Candidatus Saganbacteria bacterium]|nr:EamA family transporter [Candidatus Saganbacteria bacterium]
MINILIVLCSILLAVSGQVLMKQGMNNFGTFPIKELIYKIIPMFSSPWVISGFVLFGVSSIFWLAVLSRMELSLVYPMVSIAYVLVALISMFVFKENVSMIRWTGIAVICVGVFLISRS